MGLQIVYKRRLSFTFFLIPYLHLPSVSPFPVLKVILRTPLISKRNMATATKTVRSNADNFRPYKGPAMSKPRGGPNEGHLRMAAARFSGGQRVAADNGEAEGCGVEDVEILSQSSHFARTYQDLSVGDRSLPRQEEGGSQGKSESLCLTLRL
jgi:hypothetical protein